MYRNTATFTANNSNPVRRLATTAHTYTWTDSGGPHTRSLYSAYFYQTTNTYAYWSNLTPDSKLSVIKTKLSNLGWNNPNYHYVAILHATQTDSTSTSIDDRPILGLGETPTTLTGYPQYAYAIRVKWDPIAQSYVDSRFGCVNTLGDAIVLHEATHNMSAVQASAPDSDGHGHMRTTNDLMHSAISKRFNEGLLFDWDGTNYRGLYNFSFGTTGSSFVGASYHSC
jgi:hypothetical protein